LKVLQDREFPSLPHPVTRSFYPFKEYLQNQSSGLCVYLKFCTVATW
jgi:hypothetical protein